MSETGGRDVDVVVVGGGAAGLSAALAAARSRNVLVVVKGRLGDGATASAQGGIAAAVGPGDAPSQHLEDTVAAAAGLCRRAAARAVVEDAPAVVALLAQLGARFDTAAVGEIALGREGGHRRNRVVHAGGDRTGAEVSRVLVGACRTRGLDVLEDATVSDLLVDERGQAAGVVLVDREGRRRHVTSRAVVLATGGLGQLYSSTSNPRGATGDGVALALRAGAVVGDVEFVQFHPTLLWASGAVPGRRPLVTEALRGAGAVLVGRSGHRLMAGVHALGDLAPRDVVAARLHEHLLATGDDHAFLDATALAPTLTRDFPAVTAACREMGVDPTQEPIPVAPGAHYLCGGVRASTTGVTDVTGLFAVGEVAWTGMHGANRLASNSLLEAVSTGTQVGNLLAQRLPAPAGATAPCAPGPMLPASGRPRLTELMSAAAGVSREGTSLTRLVADLDGLGTPHTAQPSRAADVEATHLLLSAMAVAQGALLRRESRGSHRRRDHPRRDARWERNLLTRWRSGGLHTTLEPEVVSA